ncbi:MFS transporter [Rodentibacter rarus]|uniref:MFS transporter n=1 Tax=Rodentibacter rarus TaxID=1908260 RepID=A0A1V3IT54_9PAST|nr:oligopeptide:H+ symporter [Rodentibacter rarus]OOF39222.1 MFS transporter [Rodentibacter rarus]OOF45099.1 MFS transporter [Rodentibacter rarus]
MSNNTSPNQKKFFGHPSQLSTLFHIELWERFSFYGMQGILLIYLYYSVENGGLGIDKAIAGAIVGAYGGSVYLSTIFGAWLADRILGTEKTLFISGVIVMLGHIILALVPGLTGLFIGMIFIALGSGGVKSSASAMVGSLYESDELKPLRDAGFSLFYIAINIGGFLGPLLTGLLQSNIGFHYGFGIAAIGMALGLWRYALGRKNLPKPPIPHPLTKNDAQKVAILTLVISVALVGVITSGWLTLSNFSNVLLIIIIAVVILYFSRLLTNKHVSSEHQRYITAYLPLFIITCLFWAVWFQVYTVATVYFDETVDRRIGGFTVPVSWKDSLQSMWIILFSGAMAALWTKLNKKQPKTPLKFAIAMLLLALSYLTFVPFIITNTPMPMFVFSLILLGISLAELFLSPISLSFSTKIAPPMFKTQMVALNFLALSLGFTLGGVLFKDYLNTETPVDFYLLLCMIGAISGGALLFLVPKLNRMLKGID